MMNVHVLLQHPDLRKTMESLSSGGTGWQVLGGESGKLGRVVHSCRQSIGWICGERWALLLLFISCIMMAIFIFSRALCL